jgi:uncharacterized protein
MVYGRKSTGIVFDVVWRGHYPIYFPAGKKVDGLLPADYFFRRQIWLLVFGLFNAFVLLWFWDILFHYACLGMIAYSFRRLSSKTLIIAAFLCLILMTVRENVDAYRDRQMIFKGEMIAKLDTTTTKLTEKQKDDLGAMTGFKEKVSKEGKIKQMNKSLDAVRGSYGGFYEYQSERSLRGEFNYLYFGGWDILVFMFLGMAFFKSGILLGQAPAKLYWGCL